jgi:hypothetical protein
MVASFSCNKDTTIENENQHSSLNLQAQARNSLACPVPTFTVPATNSGSTYAAGSKLYKARLGVAEYRLWQKVKTLSQFNASTLSSIGLPSSLANATFALKMQKAIAVSANKPTAYERLISFFTFLHTNSTGATLTVSEMNILYNYSNSNWDGVSGTVGSYSIIHSNQWDYSGKGPLSRGQQSCTENCIGTQKFNAQFWNSIDQPALNADHEPAANFATNPDRQAFKEEAIRMFVFGGTRSTRSNTYNEINSPGLGYINTDGF